MTPKLFVWILGILIVFNAKMASAQSDDAATSAKMEFSSVFMGTLDSFRSLRGDRVKEDDNYVYYNSEYGLGSKALTILNLKSDTTQWYCFVRFHMIDDLQEVGAVETGVFGLLNMMITGGKITGKEGTEGKITRTDLYAKSNNAWLGELVSDGDKQTFHILMANTKWN